MKTKDDGLNKVSFKFVHNLHPKTENFLYQFVELFQDDLVSKSTVEAFYLFALSYCQNNDNITKEEFVKYLKKYNHISQSDKRGMAQKYYNKLMTIQEFYKVINPKH